MTIPQAFQIAVQRHQAGRLAEAEALYRQILAAQPNHAEALHLLGLIAKQAGRHDLAVEWIRKALEIKPDYPEACYNLGNALRGRGQLDEAIAAYRQALRGKPDFLEAHNNLGIALGERGLFDEAIAAHRRALEIKADLPEVHNNLGNVLRQQGLFDEAISACHRALELNPNFPEAYNNLGNALRERGLLDETISAYRRAIQLKPDYAEAHNNLGDALRERGLLDEAVAMCRWAIELKPDSAEAHNNLGNALKELGRLDEALAALHRAIQLKTGLPQAHSDLGSSLWEQGRLDEAVAAFRRALELKPDYPEAHNNLGIALRERGQLDEATACFCRALAINPALSTAHSNLILNLHYVPDTPTAMIAAECRQWWIQLGALRVVDGPRQLRDWTAGRLLRLGYVSADFCEHPVARHLLPLMREHDAGQFEVVCYSGVARPDAMTGRFRALNVQWREVAKLTDHELAAQIKEDRIDILIDLSLHTRGNRLPVFALQPAPVQASFAGYPGATGLETIAYRLTDRFLEPEGQASPGVSGRPIRLADSFWCFDEPENSPEITALPASSRGRVVFGCLHRFSKINERVLGRWSRVLKGVPEARLRMLCPTDHARTWVREQFAQFGVPSERLEFTPMQTRDRYMDTYRPLDIILDTFPYNGHMTTCDALWMGVPVISLAGEMPVSRGGLSLLSNVGLPELVAFSEEEYVRLAVELACDLPRLAALRAGLRERLRASPLMDAPRFARSVEAALRAMWRISGQENEAPGTRGRAS